jgi:hypothetical protein
MTTFPVSSNLLPQPRLVRLALRGFYLTDTPPNMPHYSPSAQAYHHIHKCQQVYLGLNEYATQPFQVLAALLPRQIASRTLILMECTTKLAHALMLTKSRLPAGISIDYAHSAPKPRLRSQKRAQHPTTGRHPTGRAPLRRPPPPRNIPPPQDAGPLYQALAQQTTQTALPDGRRQRTMHEYSTDMPTHHPPVLAPVLSPNRPIAAPRDVVTTPPADTAAPIGVVTTTTDPALQNAIMAAGNSGQASQEAPPVTHNAAAPLQAAPVPRTRPPSAHTTNHAAAPLVAPQDALRSPNQELDDEELDILSIDKVEWHLPHSNSKRSDPAYPAFQATWQCGRDNKKWYFMDTLTGVEDLNDTNWRQHQLIIAYKQKGGKIPRNPNKKHNGSQPTPSQSPTSSIMTRSRSLSKGEPSRPTAAPSPTSQRPVWR